MRGSSARLAGFLTGLLLQCACGPSPGPPPDELRSAADVEGISISGSPGDYGFHVTVSSPDTGCVRYADWWEILRSNGDLVYRRVLRHSHVNEQPFTRSGGPVPLQRDDVVWIRAHMHPDGYGGKALRGSVASGFAPANLPADFAAGLATRLPLPDGCAF